MQSESLILAVAAVIAVAAFIRALFGFADALMAMPTLAFLLDLKTASPVVAICALVSAILLVIPSWRNIRIRGLVSLVIGGALGVPIGAIFLSRADESLMKLFLGVMVLGFALWRLARPGRWHLKTDRSAWAFGLVSGTLGAAYNTGGPPIVIYSTLRRWSPTDFRSTMQGVSIFLASTIMTSHAVAGLWTREVFTLCAWSLPGLVAAILIGNVIHHRIPPERFNRLLLVLLTLIGGLLVVRSAMNLMHAAAV